ALREAERVLPAPVLDLLRSRRALARGRDPARGRGQVLLGLRLPASRPRPAIPDRAGRAGGAAAAIGPPQAHERQRARGLRPSAAHAGVKEETCPIVPTPGG